MKTKEKLLDVCARLGACWEARYYISDHKSNDAYEILKDHTEWQLWFLLRKLTMDGRRLLAKNLGVELDDFYYESYDEYSEETKRVVNECYAAWCRGK